MLYYSDLQPQRQLELAVGNWFVSTYPKSPLRNILMASRIEPDGIRHNFMNHRYKRYEAGQVVATKTLLSLAQVATLFQEVFFINVTSLLAQGNTENLQHVLDLAMADDKDRA